ncbi:MAG: BamA/TamA family outer membrane protein [FCB group bacterium]|nr:BamA/TamA family outer membrane protein [FCB group bacterium]
MTIRHTGLNEYRKVENIIRLLNRLSRSILLTLWISALAGQAPIVSQIEFIGNEITKDYIIRREIQHPVGVPLDSALAEYSRDRIDNLGIFSHVSWQAIPLEDGTVRLKYTVIESWRIFPGVLPQYSEDTGWSLQIGLLVNNFRGRNESLAVGGEIGGRQSYGIQFVDPWIVGDHVSFDMGLNKVFLQHPFLPYDVTFVAAKANIGRYFGYQRKMKIGFEAATKTFAGDSITYEYRYVAPQATFAYDTRDIYSDPTRGVYYYHFVYSMFDITGNRKNILFWDQSYSWFHTLIPKQKRLVLGLNIRGRFSFGALAEEWMEYLGGAYSVRGWKIPSRGIYQSGERSYRFGYQWLVSSVELRQTLIPKFVTKLQNEFGLSVSAFLDVGVITRSRAELFQKAPLIGMGFGLLVPTPIIQILRLDYGWAFYRGRYQERSFYLSFGQKF